MIKSLVPFSFLLMLLSCSGPKDQPHEKPESCFVSFDFHDKHYFIQGISDVNMEFYTHKWNDFEVSDFAKRKTQNPGNFSGRVTDISKDTMFEMIIDWPDSTVITEKEIMGLKNDTVWNLGPEHGNWNYDTKEQTGISMHYLLFTKNKEFMPGFEPSYIYFSDIKKSTGNTWLGRGSFELELHSGGDHKKATGGKFLLEFYIGL